MPYIGKEPVAGNFVLLDSITTSATATYALTKDSVAYSPESARNMIVSLNGVTQAPETAFTVSGSNITFSSALTSSDVIDYILVLGDVLSVGTPSDGTVGTSQMSYPLGNFSSTGIDDNATSTAITIDSSENVGIGTTTPVSLGAGYKNLDIRHTTGGGVTLGDTSNIHAYLFSDNNGVTLQSPGSRSIKFTTVSTERMRIDSSGNVGIGTTSPLLPLHVVTSGTGTSMGDNASTTLRSLAAGRASTLQLSDGTNSNYISSLSGNLGFGYGSTEAMRIDSSGNLQLGVTGGSNRRLYLRASGSTSTQYACQMENSGANNLFFVRADGSINTGTISKSPYNDTTASAANLHVSSGGFLLRSTSSARYKENIRDYDQSISIDALRPVFFNSKKEGDSKTYAGLIAEEVHDAGFTEFVEYNDDGEPDAVFYANMVALCIKEIQDLRARVAQLEGA